MSLVNQMLRDLEEREARRVSATDGAHQGGGRASAGGPPPHGRGMRLVGVLSALVLVLTTALGYLLWQRHLGRPALEAAANAGMPAPSGAPAGRASHAARPDPVAPAQARSVADNGEPAPGGPGGTRRETAAGEGPDLSAGEPTAAERAQHVTDTDKAGATGGGPGGDPDAPAAPEMSAEPDTSAAADAGGATGGGADGAQSPNAAATADAEPPGYALQLGTFSSRVYAASFLAGLPEPIQQEAYIRPVGEYQTVRIGYGETTKDLKPTRERLATHKLEGLLVRASSPPSRPAPAAEARTDADGGEVAGAADSTTKATDAASAKPAEEPAGPEAGPATGARVAKKARPLSPTHQAEQAYRRGHQALAAAANGEAEAALREALTLAPGHIEARGALADLLLRRGRQVEAKAVLREGLRTEPEASPLRQRLARVRAEEGETDRAIQLLEEGLAKARDDAGYLALLAALYQRAGRYGDSALAYRRALAVRPGTAAWLVGLGISLEGAGRPEQAGDAYRRAARTGLPPTLRDFVGKRLNGLYEGTNDDG